MKTGTLSNIAMTALVHAQINQSLASRGYLTLEMLTKVSISYPPKEMVRTKLIPIHCTQLGKCSYCPQITKKVKLPVT